jgi:hypothetical protein
VFYMVFVVEEDSGFQTVWQGFLLFTISSDACLLIRFLI